jgi:hypothetical protein
MGSGSTQASNSQTQYPVQLQPLIQTTGDTLRNAQTNVVNGTWGADAQGNSLLQQSFAPHPQDIPNLTPGQQQLSQMQLGAANTDPRTPEQIAAAGQVGQSNNQIAAMNWQANQLTGGPLGQSPATISAMNAVRGPALNDLALAGLGNSDAVGSSTAAAYAPILAQEMQMRANVLPQYNAAAQTLQGNAQTLGGLGSQAYGQQQQNEQTAFGSQEAQRQIEAQRGQASYNDFLRQINATSGVTTGILGQVPAGALSTATGGSTKVGK